MYSDVMLNAKQIDLLKPVGVTKGTVSITDMGTATYSITIGIPPGTNNVQPSLSVNYNSQSGNGILGYGWSLFANSVITRGVKTKFIDEEARGVELNNSDAYYIDGKRLYLKNGTYGASNSEYNFENEDYSIIQLVNVTSKGPDYVLLTTKDGMKMYYEYCLTRNVNGQDFNYAWYLSKVEDLHGNAFEYQYGFESNEHYLSKIVYTKNNSKSMLDYNTINFYYSKRKDINTIYDAGIGFNQSLLLDKIQITGQGGLAFKTYLFIYGYDGLYSFLNEVKEQGTDGLELNSTIFRYGVSEETLSSSTANVSVGAGKDLYNGDFDGDGITDLMVHNFKYVNLVKSYIGFSIWKRSTTSSIWIQSSPIISTPGNYEFNNQPFTVNNLQTHDFNGDGRNDILLIKTNYKSAGNKDIEYFKIYYPNASATAFTNETIYPLNITTGFPTGNYIGSGNNQGFNYITVGDFDGDGKSDFITVLSNNTGFKNFYVRPSTSNVITQIENPYATNYNYDGMRIMDSEGKLFGIEMNGDGKTELMVVENSLTKVYEIVNNPLNTLKPFKFNLLSTTGYPTKWHDILQFGDFNGDQKTDFITKVQSSNLREYAINTGVNWIGTSLPLSPGFVTNSDIKTGDFNGDGKTDYLHKYPNWNGGSASTSSFDIYLSNGKTFIKKPLSSNSLPNTLYIGDYNGDGRDDILDNGMYNSPLTIYSYGYNVNNLLLSKVKNGHGFIDEIIYNRLNSGNSFYKKNLLSTYPVNILSLPIWCVQYHNQPNGVSGNNTNVYNYENILFHRAGRGILGFTKTMNFNITLNIKNETYNELQLTYFLNIPKTYNTYRYDNNELLTQNTIIYNYTGLSGNRYKMELLKSDVFDLRTNTHVITDYEYDLYSNPLKVTKYSTPVLFKEETSVTNYVMAGGTVPNKAENSKIFKQRFTTGGGTTTLETKYTYDLKGQMIQKKDFIGMPKELTINYTYNGFGNVISETISSAGLSPRTQNFYYDNKNRFIIRKEKPCLTCVGSPTLYEYFNYSPLWGNVTFYKDQACQTKSVFYDGFGRIISSTNNLGIKTITNYKWQVAGNNVYQKEILQPNAPFEKITYDILDREVANYTQGIGGAIVQQFIKYNIKGIKQSETNQHFITETPLTTNYIYDAYNRLSRVINFQGNTSTTYAYIGNQLRTLLTFPDATTKEQWTDITGIVRKTVDRGGILTFLHNANGELINVFKNGFQILSTKFDLYNRKIQAYEPNSNITNYEYNAYGELAKQTNSNGIVHTNTYDGFGRILAVVGPEGTTNYEYGCHFISEMNISEQEVFAEEIKNELEVNTPIKSENILLKEKSMGCCAQVLKKIIGFNGITQEFEFDDYIRTIKKNEIIEGQLYSTNYTYRNLDGQLEKKTYPSGVEVKNIYDGYGNVLEKRDQTNDLLYQLHSTNGMGQPTQYKLGNNLVSTRTYSNGIPTEYLTTGVQNLLLTFNPTSGNLNQRKDLIKNLTENFTFDNLNRLVSSQVVGQPTINYQFDLPSTANTKGNIMNKSDIGKYGFNSTKINAVRKIYNPLSTILIPNVISNVTQNIIYTSFDRPESITEGINEYNLVYSPQLDRVKSVRKTNGIVTETKYYFEDCEMIVNSNGTKWVTYVEGQVGLAAIIETNGNTYTNYYTYTDHLGSILTVTNALGKVVTEQNFDAWGRKRNPINWMPIASNGSSGLDWLYRGYTGHEHINEFSLINMNGRLYDPVIGRMLSPDNVLADPYSSQSYNKYTYANNNPMCYIDPDGNIAWFIPVIIGSAIGAYSGGVIANGGEYNITKWDINSGKTWGYILGGAVVGAASGAIGSAIALSGSPFSHTVSIAASSFVNSVGTAVYTGGATSTSVSFGIASYDFDTNEWGYLGKKNNKWYGNVGYLMGGLANIQDAFSGTNGTDINVKSRPKLTGHSEVNGQFNKKTILISIGPDNPLNNELMGMKWEKQFFIEQLQGTPVAGENVSYIKPNHPQIVTRLNNVNGNLMLKWTNKLNSCQRLIGKKSLIYGVNFGCVNYSSRALFLSGVFNLNAFLPITAPVLLNLELSIRNVGIYANPYLLNLK
jgi:RHS repeat-associated protein